MIAPFPKPAALQLRFLGGCDIRLGDSLARFESNKVRALLVYLAMNPGPHERHKLMGLLWSDFPEDRARRNLRHSLWDLRRRLDSAGRLPVFLVEGETVAFNREADYWLDVEVFRRAARGLVTQTARVPSPDTLQAAAYLYGGHFLEGFHVGDALAFEEWALVEREQLQALARQVLESLVQGYLKGADYQAARTSLERLLSLDPWREEVHRQLMCLLAWLGERSSALNQYQLCRTMLVQELGVEPLHETTLLYDRIRAGTLGQDEALTMLAPPPRHPVPVSRQVASNLPAQTTAFFGREDDLVAVASLLQESGCRLLTLTGPPGVGKTRLAIEAGTQLASAFAASFPDGIYFVSLAPLTSADDVLAALVESLPAKPSGRDELGAWLRRYLRDRRLLLVLDNFEHVMAAALLVSDLLAACPLIKMLVTSREVLRLRGEHEYVVPPLPLPEAHQSLRPEALAAYPPIALFANRARAVKHGFRLTAENGPDIVGICRRLDGLPLAIELAAARIKVLAPAHLLGHLADDNRGPGLGFLTNDLQDLPKRHQALEEAISWSYDLLDESEAALFARLGVFAAGCTLESAQAVCFSPGVSLTNLLDGLSSLLDKSLLRLLTLRNEDRRYGMLVTIREFALDRLVARGEGKEVERRYADYYLTLAEAAEDGLKGPEQADWTRRIEEELGNLRAVFHRAIVHTDATTALRIGSALARFWQRHGGATEGRRWLGEALSLHGSAEAPLAFRAKALWAAGLLAWHQRSMDEARQLLEESLDLCRRMDDTEGIARVLNDLGSMATGSGHYDRARQLLTESRALYEQSGNLWGMATALSNLGMTEGSQGKIEVAASYLEQSLDLRRRLGDTTGVAYDLSNLGLTARYMGDLDRAVPLYEESLSLLTELGHMMVRTAVLSNLADIERSRGDFERAWVCYKEGLSLSHETGEKESLAVALEGLGRVAADKGDGQLAARLLGCASALRETIGVPLPDYRKKAYNQILAGIRTHMGETGAETALAEGRNMSLDEILSLVEGT